MQKLYVTLQNDDTRKWTVIGVLEKEGDSYKFSFTKGSRTVPNSQRFGALKEDVTRSQEIFAFFYNRILNSSRPEFQDMLKWLNLDNRDYDLFDILALTEGKRATDRIEIFMAPFPKDGRFQVNFFAHGIRHTHLANETELEGVKTGTKLYLMRDIQNKNDENAIALRTENPVCFLGYLPRYLAVDVVELLKFVDVNDISTSIIKYNSDAPMSFRYLCQIDAPWPDIFNPCAGEDYQPLAT